MRTTQYRGYQSKDGSRRDQQSVYMDNKMLDEIEPESHRLERPISWLMARAWVIAREEIRKLPTATEPFADEDTLVETRDVA